MLVCVSDIDLFRDRAEALPNIKASRTMSRSANAANLSLGISVTAGKQAMPSGREVYSFFEDYRIGLIVRDNNKAHIISQQR